MMATGAGLDAPQIRLASAGDVAGLTRLFALAYTKYVERIGKKPAPMTADYAAIVAAGDVWVLDSDGVLVGAIVLQSADDHLLLSNVAVSPDRQGEGLGAHLLAFAQDEARRRGLGEMRLYTNAQMHENLAIYAHLGWTRYAEGDQDGFRRIFMRKAVSI